MAKLDSYVICTSPRSGSTLLCQLLADTGVAGVPESYFHRPDPARWARAFRLADTAPLPDGLAAAQQAGRGESGIFGLRLQSHSRAFLLDCLRAQFPGHVTDAACLQAAFGATAYIYLNRADKLAQAISYIRAQQSGLWHAATDGTAIERLAPQAPYGYDAAAIRAQRAQFAADDQAWIAWFAQQNIQPYRIGYDALAQDPAGALRGVLGFLGLDLGAADGVCPTVAKLADGESHAWAARFRAESTTAGA